MNTQSHFGSALAYKISCYIGALVLSASCSVTSKPSYVGQDVNGKPTRLDVLGRLPRRANGLGMIRCDAPNAVGTYTHQYPIDDSPTNVLTFCFGIEDSEGYGIRGQFFRDADGIRVCLSRYDGYCDEEACVTFVYYDVCSTLKARPAETIATPRSHP